MSSISERRYDIDWLRVLAVLLLIPYHTAVIFTRPYVAYIKAEPNAAMEAFAYFMNQWHMALLFLVSGVGAWYSLERRTGRRFCRERVRRLIIPLIFGTLVIVPVQVYFQRLYNQEFTGSLLRFYLHIFDGIYPHGNFTWGQLWFLAYLFVFSLLLLPVFLYLKTENGRTLLNRASDFFGRRGAVFAAALPFMIAQAVFRAKWPGFQNLYNDWANFAFYITAFFYGYVLVSAQGFSQAIEKNRHVALVLGIVTMALILALRQSGIAPAPDYSGKWVLYMLLHGFGSWCILVAILGFARSYLNSRSGFLEYANEAALPFYILHHAAIVSIAYFVVGKSSSLLVEFIAIAVPATALAAGIYDVLVRRVAMLRFLFGMRPKLRIFQLEPAQRE
jgi:glucan biosynthesis protein C